MMHPVRVFVLVAVLVLVKLAPGAVAGAESIPSGEATQHVGETVTVCGPVAGAASFDRLNGQPTFLNFDRSYPDQSFTVVIWGANAGKFERPPHQMFAGKEICVTGTIETYRGKPQIVVGDPAQIAVAAPSFEGDRFSREERILLKAMLAELGLGADPGDDAWDRAADQALRSFQAGVGLEAQGERSAPTLRALAVAVDSLDVEARGRVLKLLLLNLAQREEGASR